MKKRCVIIAIAVLAMVNGSLYAQLTDTYWTDAGADHLWDTTDNWDNGVPGPGYRAYINLASANAAVITTGIDADLDEIQVAFAFNPGTRDGQIDMDGGTLSCPGSSFIGVGLGSTGTVNMSSGTYTGGNIFMGEYSGNGTMNLSGDAVVIVSQNILPGGRTSPLEVGSVGTLNMTDDAQVITNHLSGSDSPETVGELNMDENAYLHVTNNQLYLGVQGIFTANINGPNTLVETDNHVYLAFAKGTSTLNVSTGATVAAEDAFLIGSPDEFNTGNGTVNMLGGTASCGGTLYVGQAGTGHLQLDSGTFTAGGLTMRSLGGTGTIDITGGALILSGPWSASSAFFSDGWITAYGGSGELVFDFADGWTTITADIGVRVCGDPLTVYLPGDINEDCKIDLLDFAALSADWMKCTDPADPMCDQYY